MLSFYPCTKEDAKQAVPLIYSSGPDAFDYVFKDKRHNAHDFLRFAFSSKGGEFSFENHYKITENGSLIGVGAVFSHKEARSFTLADAIKIIRFYKHRALGVMLRGLKVEQLIKLPKKGEIVIGHLGVTSSRQGKGLGTQLIQFLKEKANATRNDHFILDVSEKNTKARVLYERLGFKITHFNPSDLKNNIASVPNHYRMEHV